MAVLGRWHLLLSALVLAGNLFAADVTADFSAANKLYAQGRFAEAAQGYEHMLQTGVQSPALLFNYANAEFKAGHLGKAIAAYQQAVELSPRDPELRANLAFVRNQVPGANGHAGRWPGWFDVLTLNEGALLTAGLLWLTFGLLIARQLRPALAPKLRTLTRVGLVATMVSGAVLGVRTADHFNARSAVVIADNATARSGPFDDAQNAFMARDGAEFSVLARRDDWVQVTDGSGRTGWLPARQVEILPGA